MRRRRRRATSRANRLTDSDASTPAEDGAAAAVAPPPAAPEPAEPQTDRQQSGSGPHQSQEQGQDPGKAAESGPAPTQQTVRSTVAIDGLPDLDDCVAICKAWPDRVASLFKSLNLEQAELAGVREAVIGQDLPTACLRLLDHFSQRPTDAIFRAAVRMPGANTWFARKLARKTSATADQQLMHEAEGLLAGQISLGELPGALANLGQGRIDWLHTGPRKDLEWTHQLNRHNWLTNLLAAGLSSGRQDLLDAMQRHLVDWLTCLTRNPRSPTEASLLDGKDRSPMWRTVEIGLRLRDAWPLLFFASPKSARGLKAGTRLLMLLAVRDSADFINTHQSNLPSHRALEMTGLAFAALAWPEFNEAKQWLSTARDQLTSGLWKQSYPDGSQKELSSTYQLVALHTLTAFSTILDSFGAEAPDAHFRQTIERMWDHLARTIQPDGHAPLNNDSDLSDIRAGLRRAATRFGRADWQYAATAGAEGEQPDGPASRYQRWAGQLVTRNNWGSDAHYAFLDLGPTGYEGHQHHDHLHLSIHAGGRPLLVDAGRYTQRADAWRQYFNGSASHNVALIDGCGQAAGPAVSVRPNDHHVVMENDHCFALGHHEAGFLNLVGENTHSRGVCYVTDAGWIVFDRIAVDKPRTVDLLWHFHPHCTVATEGSEVFTTDPDIGNLRITPIGQLDWSIDLIRGQETKDLGEYPADKPSFAPDHADQQVVQGWYAPGYNQLQPASCARFRCHIDRPSTFAWLLTPGTGATARPVVKEQQFDDRLAKVQLTWPQGPTATAHCSFIDGLRHFSLQG